MSCRNHQRCLCCDHDPRISDDCIADLSSLPSCWHACPGNAEAGRQARRIVGGSWSDDNAKEGDEAGEGDDMAAKCGNGSAIR